MEVQLSSPKLLLKEFHSAADLVGKETSWKVGFALGWVSKPREEFMAIHVYVKQ